VVRIGAIEQQRLELHAHELLVERGIQAGQLALYVWAGRWIEYEFGVLASMRHNCAPCRCKYEGDARLRLSYALHVNSTLAEEADAKMKRG
jgi:hypothetical protein